MRKAGGYRPAFKHCEDYDLWLRLWPKHRITNLPDALLHYRVSPGQVTALHLAQQGLAALAARKLADLRESGSPEPLFSGEPVTPAFLMSLGFSAGEIVDRIASAYEGRVSSLASLGLWADAERTAASVVDLPAEMMPHREARATRYWLEYVLARKRQDRPMAAILGVQALALRPRVAYAQLKRKALPLVTRIVPGRDLDH